MTGYSRILKRQAGATPRELIVIAALIGMSAVFLLGFVGYGLSIVSLG